MRAALWIGGLGVALGVAACSGSVRSPSPSPLPSPVLGIDWGRAAPVERPADAFAEPSTLPVPEGTGRSGHPLHYPGLAILADVVGLPAGGYVAVGYVYPGWHPAAWTSPDAITWSLQDMGAEEFTFPVAAVSGPDGSIVAVGRSGSDPVAWTSPDGHRWTRHEVATLSKGSVAERMTTVIATPDGFLAGGSAGPELADRHARFWRSADGVRWTPVPDDADGLANAEVRSIVRVGDRYVAVGLVGSVQSITGSVAWTSADGETWARVDDAALAGGRAVALTTAPFGGVVAVGSDLDRTEAVAWASADGSEWARAPGEASRRYEGKILMTDVTVVGDQLIGVGNYIGLQRPTASSWVSVDGVHWRRSRDAPVQEQGEFYAVIPGGPGIIAVGSTGFPDDFIPVVWLSPAR